MWFSLFLPGLFLVSLQFFLSCPQSVGKERINGKLNQILHRYDLFLPLFYFISSVLLFCSISGFSKAALFPSQVLLYGEGIYIISHDKGRKIILTI